MWDWKANNVGAVIKGLLFTACLCWVRCTLLKSLCWIYCSQLRNLLLEWLPTAQSLLLTAQLTKVDVIYNATEYFPIQKVWFHSKGESSAPAWQLKAEGEPLLRKKPPIFLSEDPSTGYPGESERGTFSLDSWNFPIYFQHSFQMSHYWARWMTIWLYPKKIRFKF